eukprot:tig00001269_g7977.t1
MMAFACTAPVDVAGRSASGRVFADRGPSRCTLAGLGAARRLRPAHSGRAVPQSWRPAIRFEGAPRAQAAAAAGGAAPVPSPAEKLTGDDARLWAEGAARVLEAVPALEPQEVETAMKHAFGWTDRAFRYWRGEYKDSAPPEGQVEAVLGMLTGELGLGEEEVQHVVKKFPEVLGLSGPIPPLPFPPPHLPPASKLELRSILKLFLRFGLRVEKRIRPALATLAKEHRIEGDKLRQTIARLPQVLGFNYDCYMECRGDCMRCWNQL